jgi:hypothetical protein
MKSTVTVTYPLTPSAQPRVVLEMPPPMPFPTPDTPLPTPFTTPPAALPAPATQPCTVFEIQLLLFLLLIVFDSIELTE